MGLAAGTPALLVPEVAFAATTDTVLLAAGVSGVTGAALGLLVGGGVGYVLNRRQRREFERLVARLAQPNEPARPVADASPRTRAAEAPGTRPDAVRQVAPTPDPESVRSRFELIDELPEEPLRIVEAAGGSAEATAPSARRDLGSIPDPLAVPEPEPVAKVPVRDAEVAPGHGFVGSSDRSVAPTPYVPSASNPYLDADSRATSQAKSQAKPQPRATRDSRQPFDYGDFAVDYVAKKSLKERMTLTAMGVAAVLGERMGRNMMDGMPVIERADGSVGDVGTTWWERDDRIQQRPKAPEMPATELAAVSSMADYATRLEIPATAAQSLTGAERSSLIVGRVAPIEEEAYPEVGSQWRQREDVWESALAALDERVEDNLMAGREERSRRRVARRSVASARPQRVTVVAPPVEPRSFADAVGAIDTLDEPDGLERDTQFLNFRAPGNHPEVQDTGSYINYLIEDEFKRNPSTNARHQARSFLRVHEGGQNTRAQEAI